MTRSCTRRTGRRGAGYHVARYRPDSRPAAASTHTTAPDRRRKRRACVAREILRRSPRSESARLLPNEPALFTTDRGCSDECVASWPGDLPRPALDGMFELADVGVIRHQSHDEAGADQYRVPALRGAVDGGAHAGLRGALRRSRISALSAPSTGLSKSTPSSSSNTWCWCCWSRPGCAGSSAGWAPTNASASGKDRAERLPRLEQRLRSTSS